MLHRVHHGDRSDVDLSLGEFAEHSGQHTRSVNQKHGKLNALLHQWSPVLGASHRRANLLAHTADTETQQPLNLRKPVRARTLADEADEMIVASRTFERIRRNSPPALPATRATPAPSRSCDRVKPIDAAGPHPSVHQRPLPVYSRSAKLQDTKRQQLQSRPESAAHARNQESRTSSSVKRAGAPAAVLAATEAPVVRPSQSGRGLVAGGLGDSDCRDVRNKPPRHQWPESGCRR